MSEPELPLVGDYVAREMPWTELRPRYRELRPLVFENEYEADTARLLTEDEKDAGARLGHLMSEVYRLNYGIFLHDELVGWSMGVQQGVETYYMINTGIFAEHQGKGIYKALLPAILARLSADGFQVVTSRHVVTNNRVIIPKLRAGFVISGCELTDRFGMLVHLAYYSNPARRRLYAVRAGSLRPDDEVKDALGLR